MIITKGAVRDMKDRIEADKDFGTGGHYSDTHRDRECVDSLGNYIRSGPELVIVPEALIQFLEHGDNVLSDIIKGINRPLHYLCSDCRYPKWCLTKEELEAKYSHVKAYIDRPLREDGFCDVSDGCPKCGD
jgi:hypothetical protein